MAEFIKGGGSSLFLHIIEDGDGTTRDARLELPFTTESFNPVGEFINSNAIAGGRSRGIGCIGNKAGDGSFDVELTTQNFGVLFYAALGDISTSGLIITPTVDDLPIYDIFIRHGSTNDMLYKFSSQKVNSMRLSFTSNGILTASFDFAGLTWEAVSTLPAASVDKALTAGNTILCPAALNSLKVNDINVMDTATGLEFTIANNLDTDTNALDASGRLAVLTGELSVTGSITFITPRSGSLFTLLKTLDIGDELGDIEIGIGSATDSILLKNVYVTQPVHDITDRGKVAFRVDFQAVQDGTVPPITVNLVAGMYYPLTLSTLPALS